MRRNSILLAAGALTGLASAQSSGDINVLTMNVAGLPAILQGNDVPGDKTVNSRLIGTKFVQHGYDVVNVQEDFNYHAALYSTATLPFRTATSGGVPFGSGLNTLSQYEMIDTVRVKWDTCSNDSGSDCLTPKGFTLTRLAVSDDAAQGAAFVDVYNFHTDAGTAAGDLTARTANLRQLSAYITRWSAGNAVIAFGDSNSRYSRTPDDIRVFRRENGMTDPWVELVRGGVEPTAETICQSPSTTNTCETVDKVFYRSGPTLNLAAVGWAYDSTRFLQPDGSILSDHNPVAANLTWSLPATLRQSAFLGGPHGDWSSDAAVLAARPSTPRATRLAFRGGARLDAVSVTLADGTVLARGGTGGTASELVLAANERWTATTLCQGKRNDRTRIFSIEARTSAGRTLRAGTTTSECRQFTAPAGWAIVGFLGRGGDEIDRLGFLYARQ
ncbi:hypothetical protein BN1723_007037, partial [Verticillium longisporum]